MLPHPSHEGTFQAGSRQVQRSREQIPGTKALELRVGLAVLRSQSAITASWQSVWQTDWEKALSDWKEPG